MRSEILPAAVPLAPAVPVAGSASDDFFSVLAQKAPKESAGAEHWQAWGSGSGGTSSLGSTLIEPQAFFERVPADLCPILPSLRLCGLCERYEIPFIERFSGGLCGGKERGYHSVLLR